MTFNHHGFSFDLQLYELSVFNITLLQRNILPLQYLDIITSESVANAITTHSLRFSQIYYSVSCLH